MFVAQNISTGFKKSNNKILHQSVNFELNQGDFMLLIGSNGIGKSTLLKTILGIYPPLNGKFFFNNEDITFIPSRKKSKLISMMLPNSPNVEMMSAFEVAMTGLNNQLKPWNSENQTMKSKLKFEFETAGISQLINQKFTELSDGEKQKVMLIRCLIQDTPILLLDEPLAFLDYQSKIKFLNLLSSKCKIENKIVVLSTHDLDVSLPFATKIFALKKTTFMFFEKDNFKLSDYLNETA
jgi:iron complex transport system ATP-binding protein